MVDIVAVKEKDCCCKRKQSVFRVLPVAHGGDGLPQFYPKLSQIWGLWGESVTRSVLTDGDDFCAWTAWQVAQGRDGDDPYWSATT